METGRIKKKKSAFTVVPNDILQMDSLTWKAKGLMCYLLSLPDNWELYKSELVTRSKDGYDSMISGWNELENAGFISTNRVKEGGLFVGYEYVINETRVRDFPEQDFPEQENPQLIKTNSIHKSTNSKKEIIKDKFLEAFDVFWKAYPNKIGKAKAQTSFLKLKKEEVDKIFATLPTYLKNPPFAGYCFPNPATYINQKRFDDEIKIISTAAPSSDLFAGTEVYTEQSRVIDHSKRIA